MAKARTPSLIAISFSLLLVTGCDPAESGPLPDDCPAFARIAEFALRTGEIPPPRTDAVAARLGLDAEVDRPDTILTEQDDEGAVAAGDDKVRAVPAADPVSTGSGR